MAENILTTGTKGPPGWKGFTNVGYKVFLGRKLHFIASGNKGRQWPPLYKCADQFFMQNTVQLISNYKFNTGENEFKPVFKSSEHCHLPLLGTDLYALQKHEPL